MSIPFLIDVSAFYGEPDPYEQSSGVILDKNKTLSLHRKIDNANAGKRKGKKSAGAIGFKESGGAISMKQDTAGAIGFKEPSAGAVAMQQHAPHGGALAFNEQTNKQTNKRVC